MAKHTHYVKVTVETGNAGDDEPHQEVIIHQRTESSVDNTMFQQGLTRALTEFMIGLGDAANAQKSGKQKQAQADRR